MHDDKVGKGYPILYYSNLTKEIILIQQIMGVITCAYNAL